MPLFYKNLAFGIYESQQTYKPWQINKNLFKMIFKNTKTNSLFLHLLALDCLLCQLTRLVIVGRWELIFVTDDKYF